MKQVNLEARDLRRQKSDRLRQAQAELDRRFLVLVAQNRRIRVRRSRDAEWAVQWYNEVGCVEEECAGRRSALAE